MEGIAIGALFNSILPKLLQKIKDSKREKIAISRSIDDFQREAEVVQSQLEDGYSQSEYEGKAKLMGIDRRLKVLCQDTHDCIHRFLRKGSMESCAELAAKIQGFNDNVHKLHDEARECITSLKASAKPSYPYVPPDKVVDRLERLAELQDLVQLPSSQDAPKVISILGFDGLGKTILARKFYDSTQAHAKFHHQAWVTAAGTHEELVHKILKQIDVEGDHGHVEDLYGLCDRLRDFLKGKEYLIVIDDMKRCELWNGIKHAFDDVKGIVLVTTTIQAVANTCSQCINGYVYKLSPLDEHESLDLFETACSNGDSGHAAEILKKCGGLPLAILNVANYLQREDVLSSAGCKAACRDLGALLVQDNGSNLPGMQQVLMNKYTGLPSCAIRSCLLYFCMYKLNMDALPKRNSLIRRWQAEGFVDGKTGSEYLKTLINRNIIQTMEVNTDGTTKRCRPPGMMAEYISEISKSENFAALVSDLEETRKHRIRRLSFDDGSAADDRRISGMDFSIVLTLAISGIGSEAILNFEKYELLAVLDLKECTSINDNHVEAICMLLLLKYLSLGKTIGKIPRAIGKLELLEMLEMRTTETVLVHREVLQLPNLKHLIGKFHLIYKRPIEVEISKDERLKKFLSNKSVLETVTAYVSRTAKGFPEPMLHMMQLRKVKIVCTYEADDTDKEVLTTAIKKFIHRGTNNVICGHSHSLSINFYKCTSIVHECLLGPGSLTSLKLRGDWRPFLGANPDFTNISGITKMCLSHTYLSGNKVLAGLTGLIALEYLKLEEEDMGSLEIEPETFQKLTGLCLVGEKSLYGITIKPRALPRLVSLHLICQVIDRTVQLLDGRLERLREIALHSGVAPEIKEAWKKAAKLHPNRPEVVFIHKA
ncbi:hypothetical protein CFC21_045034 [Triticum aestivum]|uniref:NB-ARC domain-containing protein n=3 Tax=Triticum TaxID=4564 RepID=A0A9R1JY78_WHEAT|nr:hypothetical protein CFC21_045031 [Triticum aestivum]KAF7033974.1 hypothetical protein CFC21_045034 [Triticum aestivum]VAH86699.1 unnamed protein product [Triticum turgidum subsp. durum]